MMYASLPLRRIELALWFIGLSLLGVFFGATWDRWQYQQREERALFAMAPDRAAEPAPAPQPSRVAVDATPVGPSAFVGPVRPAVTRDVHTVATQSRQPVEAVRNEEVPLDPRAFGRIEIPRLGVRAIVAVGADEATLSHAVGLVPGAARPGEAGNTVLAGHRDTFFRPLRRIRLNDTIRVRLPQATYEYRVDELRVVSPEETSVLASNGSEELTLITCYPFRYIGPAPDRFIVKASRVN